jgi:hypothetical protein
VGPGIAYHEKVGIRDDAKKERDAAQKAVNQIRARVTTELNAANRNNLKNAHSTISTAKTQLAKLQAQRTADLAAQKKQIYADTGLLARLEALSILSARRSTLKVAHWTLFALFLSIEVLPVLTKLLQVLGPETIYDKLTASADAVTRRIHRQSDAGRLKVHRSQQRIELQLERDRARRALAAGKKYNKKVTKTQQAVISAALDAWSRHAFASTQQALADWQQQMASNGRPLSGPPVTLTKPMGIQMQPPGPVSSTNGHTNGQTGPLPGPPQPQPPTQWNAPKLQPTPQGQPAPQVQPVSPTVPVQPASDQANATSSPASDPASDPAYDPVSYQLTSDYGPADQVYLPADPAQGEVGIRDGETDGAPAMDFRHDEPQLSCRPSGRHARDEVYDQEADLEQAYDEEDEAFLAIRPNHRTYREPRLQPDEEDL